MRVGYKLIDHTVDFKTAQGYKTAFMYLKEHEEGSILKETLDDYLGITIRSGCLSYAEIPKEYFHKLLGVTGTLKNLHSEI